MSSINCNGTLINLNAPKVMGILNITPDSFFDGGKHSTNELIIKHVKKMLNEGATFIDIGAYSSRPGAKHISEKEELIRLLPVLELILKNFPKARISVDTFRSNVAEKAIIEGASLINDISAGAMDTKMFSTVAKLQVPYIIMHMQGTPQTMQTNPSYKNVVTDVLYYFSEKLQQLRLEGINDIIADVGFGFGKTIEHNYTLLNNLELFKNLEIPILSGISRKSMLYKPLNISSNEALNATTIANVIALQKGTNILRVHDVKEAMEAIKILDLLS
ncbi:dihydropteroate synthase [uncultured Lutibacter sp.]|uniref:dihydropteroate synthase n=1 Tax=uncultured Lutibacter sp. TaxID=437739 RepID=UPI0026121DF0|nr:dihydropteroate synthase [uncultured Lutibacter sp.]